MLVSYLPVLKLDLHLSDQFVAAHFFLSHLILVFAWALSGPGVAAVLSLLSALLSIYLGLGSKEPAFYLQVLVYGGLFFFMALYLQASQQKANDKRIAREKIYEDLNLAEKEIVKKDELKEALQKKIDHFLDLQRFSEELKGAQGLDEIARKIVLEARQVLAKADECVLYLVDEPKQELQLIAADPALNDEDPEEGGRAFDHWVMKRSQAVMIEDTRDDFRFTSETKPDLDDWRSVCASPLITENKVLGVIRANAARPGTFTADDLRLLDIFSSLGAVTLRNELLYRTMGELATRDSLTGLYVNRFFQERLAEESRRASRNQEPFAVILFDIDHFKRYNDEYGHSAGDLVLKNIGALLQRTLGPSDLAARYGGEEFVVLMPGKGKKEARALAEKIRVEIEETVFVLRRVARRVTASFGVAVFPAAKTKEAVMIEADRRLYEAKKGGRNRICGGT
ncbi:MAG TPA: sensor domain-containing diguanylate cyclase [Candidatus Eisenbacteria bacterium]|nr:sensor domain-containing diguanylate cyclase [Candidatus Eisenbacteria bacterium]